MKRRIEITRWGSIVDSFQVIDRKYNDSAFVIIRKPEKRGDYFSIQVIYNGGVIFTSEPSLKRAQKHAVEVVKERIRSDYDQRQLKEVIKRVVNCL